MTDLHEINPRSNPYFRDPRIRRHLIRAGLINRYGDIIRSSSSNVSPARSPGGRRARGDQSKGNDDHVAEEKEQRRKVIRNHVDFALRPARKSKRRRSISRSLPNMHRSPTRRPKSAHYSSRDSGDHFVSRSAKEKSSTKSDCRVIMTYHGQQIYVEYDKSWYQQKGDEILVMQQHCGGENLTVFKGFVEPGKPFAFDSKRHRDYPFALALYINGLIDCRISVCCEYKHKKNALLGGPHGAFSITDVQKVKPCLSCRYRRDKKKSKSTASLPHESTRYAKSVVPPLQTGHHSSSDSLVGSRRTQGSPEAEEKKPGISSSVHHAAPTEHHSSGHSLDESRRTQGSPEAEEKKPGISSSVHHAAPTEHHSSGHSLDESRRTQGSPEAEEKKPRISSPVHDAAPNGHKSKIYKSPSLSSEAEEKKPHISSPVQHSAPTSYKSKIHKSPSSSSEDDDKKPGISSSVHHAAPTDHKPKIHKSSSSGSEDDDKKPEISSSVHHAAPTVHKSKTPKSPSLTSEDDDKKPAIAAVIQHLPIVPPGHKSNIRSPTLSGTSLSSAEADERKPPISSARRSSSGVPTSYTSNIPHPVPSQNNDDENYSSDFDKSNNGDSVPTNSRFGRPRISDSDSVDEGRRSNNKQAKYSPSPSDANSSSDDRDNHQSSKISTGKKNTIEHSRKSSFSTTKKLDSSDDEDSHPSSPVLTKKNNTAGYSRRSSSSTSRKSGPRKDENGHHSPVISNGSNNVADDSESSSSRKSGPSPTDKTKRELNDNNQFSSTKDTDGNQRLLNTEDYSSTKKNDDIHYSSNIRRTSTSSAEDIFGIKPSPPKEKKKDVQVFSKEWFETSSRDQADDDDQFNLSPSSKTKSRSKDNFFDEDD